MPVQSICQTGGVFGPVADGLGSGGNGHKLLTGSHEAPYVNLSGNSLT